MNQVRLNQTSRMDCCECFAKYILCLVNFVFFVSIVIISADQLDHLHVQVIGSVVLSIGIWLAADKNSFIQITRLQALSQAEVSTHTKLSQSYFSFIFSPIASHNILLR